MKTYRFLYLLLALAAGFTSYGQTPARPPLIGVSHITFQTAHPEQAIRFYRDFLGYPLIERKKAKGGDALLLVFRVNERQTIQILTGLPPDRDERLVEVGYQTTDVEALRQYLQSRAVSVPEKVTSDGKLRSFAVTDADKHTLRFTEYEAEPVSGKDNRVSDRILHAGYQIRDQTTADRFYKETLGFSEIWRGGSTDSVTNWINMRLPNGLDYLEYMLAPGPVNRQQLGSMNHVCLLVPDLQKALTTLRERARTLKLPVGDPRLGRNNKWQLNLFDPDGTRVELMEPFTFR